MVNVIDHKLMFVYLFARLVFRLAIIPSLHIVCVYICMCLCVKLGHLFCKLHTSIRIDYMHYQHHMFVCRESHPDGSGAVGRHRPLVPRLVLISQLYHLSIYILSLGSVGLYHWTNPNCARVILKHKEYFYKRTRSGQLTPWHLSDRFEHWSIEVLLPVWQWYVRTSIVVCLFFRLLRDSSWSETLDKDQIHRKTSVSVPQNSVETPLGEIVDHSFITKCWVIYLNSIH